MTDAVDRRYHRPGRGAGIRGGYGRTTGASLAMAETLKGRFLVAGNQLRDESFFRSVVLVLEHTREGAMGLIVNRPSSLTIATALSEEMDVRGCDEPLFSGGPVEPGDLFLLHGNERLSEESHEVCEGVYVTASAEAFERVLVCDHDGPFRALSGYAGWASGQLETELQGGDWLVCEATAVDVFDVDPYEAWDRLKSRVNRAHQLVPGDNLNPDWN